MIRGKLRTWKSREALHGRSIPARFVFIIVWGLKMVAGPGHTGGVLVFAGGREIRVSSLERSDFASSRAHLNHQQAREYLSREMGIEQGF